MTRFRMENERGAQVDYKKPFGLKKGDNVQFMGDWHILEGWLDRGEQYSLWISREIEGRREEGIIKVSLMSYERGNWYVNEGAIAPF